jgi:hypothetical protein
LWRRHGDCGPVFCNVQNGVKAEGETQAIQAVRGSSFDVRPIHLRRSSLCEAVFLFMFCFEDV